MNILEYNRTAWDREVERGNIWTVPVSSEVIEAARRGEWDIVLTPARSVPKVWFGELQNRDVLCLASGGGQQGPVLAAAGARVTVLDNSPNQLAQDRLVAERDGLSMTLVQGDMADLHMFADASFDLIVHPCSNCFAPDVRPVWREAFRVLRPGGSLMAGFINPALFIFDDRAMEERGEFIVRHSLPYSDIESLTEEERRYYTDKEDPLAFSHTLEDQIGGQLEAGFMLATLLEDTWPGHPLSQYMPCFIMTRSVKP